MRSRSINLTTRSGNALLKCHRSDLIQRPGDGTLLPGGWYPEPPESAIYLLLASFCRSCFVSAEFRVVGQHAVQYHGELAGERDLGLAHAGASGQTHPPALQCRALDWSGQDDVGRLVERSAHAAVADLGNAAGDVGLARLILFGGQAKMRTYRLGRSEATVIVNCRYIGEPDDRADAGCGHQQPNAAILPGQGSNAFLQLLPLLEERAARRKQR